MSQCKRYSSASLCSVNAVNNFSGMKFPDEFSFPRKAFQKLCEQKGWYCPFDEKGEMKSKVERRDLPTFSLAEAAYLMAGESSENHIFTDRWTGQDSVVVPESGMARRIYDCLCDSLVRDEYSETIALQKGTLTPLPPKDNPFNYYDHTSVTFERRYYYYWWIDKRGERAVPSWLLEERQVIEAEKGEIFDDSDEAVVVDGVELDFLKSLLDKNSPQYRPRLLAAILSAKDIPQARKATPNLSNPSSVRKHLQAFIKTRLRDLNIQRNVNGNLDVVNEDVKAVLRILEQEEALKDGRPSAR